MKIQDYQLTEKEMYEEDKIIMNKIENKQIFAITDEYDSKVFLFLDRDEIYAYNQMIKEDNNIKLKPLRHCNQTVTSYQYKDVKAAMEYLYAGGYRA